MQVDDSFMQKMDGGSIIQSLYKDYKNYIYYSIEQDIICHYYEGKLFEIPYKEGKVEGLVKQYDESGRLYKEAQYKNDLKEGIEKMSLENNRAMFEIPYKAGKPEGIAKAYFFGRLESETPYKEGLKEGIKKGYYESGKLQSETPYKANKKEGIEKHYNKDGSLAKEICYKNDLKVKCD